MVALLEVVNCLNFLYNTPARAWNHLFPHNGRRDFKKKSMCWKVCWIQAGAGAWVVLIIWSISNFRLAVLIAAVLIKTRLMLEWQIPAICQIGMLQLQTHRFENKLTYTHPLLYWVIVFFTTEEEKWNWNFKSCSLKIRFKKEFKVRKVRKFRWTIEAAAAVV